MQQTTPYSITRLLGQGSVGGVVMPSVQSRLEFMASSNVCGSKMGISLSLLFDFVDQVGGAMAILPTVLSNSIQVEHR